MEGQRFDLIGRRLATREGRRDTLRGIAAVSLATGLGLVGVDVPASAKSKNKKMPLGAPCKSTNMCKGSLVCQKALYPDADSDFRKRCCRMLGAGCEDDFACCGLLVCNNGICVID